MNINKSITIVKEYIENRLGGTVEVVKDSEMEVVNFAWSKNPKTVAEEHMGFSFSFKDLSFLPTLLAEEIISNYLNPKDVEPEVIEEVKEEEPMGTIEEVIAPPQKRLKKGLKTS